MKRYYNLKDFVEDSKFLADKIKNKKRYERLFPIVRGGVPLALELSKCLNIPLTDDLSDENILVVDDLIDSGKTREKYKKYDFACLQVKERAKFKPTYFVSNVGNEWIDYWWEESRENLSEDLVVRMLQYIGEDPNRTGLKETPMRVIKMWKEIFRGYDEKQKPKVTTFPNDGTDGFLYDTMLRDEGYFFSHCEHHGVPFFGQYFFGYIPDRLLLGASKIARTVDYFSAKLQIAERLVSDIVNHLDSEVKSKGMILVMNARHLCKEMRGVKKFNSPFEAITVTGYFAKNKDGCKDEFLSRIK